MNAPEPITCSKCGRALTAYEINWYMDHLTCRPVICCACIKEGK